MRDDLELRPFAAENGFTEKLSDTDRMYKRVDIPHDSISFERNGTVTWNIREGWQVADLIDGHYKNHRPQKTLRQALDLIIKEQEDREIAEDKETLRVK